MCYFVSVDLLHRCRLLTSHVIALPRQTTNPSYPNEIHLEARHRADCRDQYFIRCANFICLYEYLFEAQLVYSDRRHCHPHSVYMFPCAHFCYI